MPLAEDKTDGQADWEITPEGLYIATRQFLIRRGYCCANRCRNCPYINWREQLEWQHAPRETIRRNRVSPRAINGAHLLLAYHECALQNATDIERGYHLDMIAHYSLLLERWNN